MPQTCRGHEPEAWRCGAHRRFRYAVRMRQHPERQTGTRARQLASAIFAALLFIAVAPAARAQTAAATPTADPKDVGSISAIVTALYDVISGPAGKARDWDRFRSLFASGARMIAVGRPKDQAPHVGSFSVEDYVKYDDAPMRKSGFFERETGRATNEFRGIASVFSAYESRLKTDGPIFERGVNDIQLFNDGTRWYIVTVFWDNADDAHPVPSLPAPPTQ